MSSDGEKQTAQRMKAAPDSVLHLRVGGDILGRQEIRELMDLLEAATHLRAYVEWFDPTSGDYRIVLLGGI